MMTTSTRLKVGYADLNRTTHLLLTENWYIYIYGNTLIGYDQRET
jgi:hypothetical protein